jgi:hypothetical protein
MRAGTAACPPVQGRSDLHSRGAFPGFERRTSEPDGIDLALRRKARRVGIDNPARRLAGDQRFARLSARGGSPGERREPWPPWAGSSVGATPPATGPMVVSCGSEGAGAWTATSGLVSSAAFFLPFSAFFKASIRRLIGQPHASLLTTISADNDQQWELGTATPADQDLIGTSAPRAPPGTAGSRRDRRRCWGCQ